MFGCNLNHIRPWRSGRLHKTFQTEEVQSTHEETGSETVPVPVLLALQPSCLDLDLERHVGRRGPTVSDGPYRSKQVNTQRKDSTCERVYSLFMEPWSDLAQKWSPGPSPGACYRWPGGSSVWSWSVRTPPTWLPSWPLQRSTRRSSPSLTWPASRRSSTERYGTRTACPCSRIRTMRLTKRCGPSCPSSIRTASSTTLSTGSKRSRRRTMRSSGISRSTTTPPRKIVTSYQPGNPSTRRIMGLEFRWELRTGMTSPWLFSDCRRMAEWKR